LLESADGDPAGPYRFKGQLRVPQPYAIHGPGHGSFFTSPDGHESWMIYHATDDQRGCFTGGRRTTRARRFRWNADGTPAFGMPASPSTDIVAPGGDGTIAVQAEDAVREPSTPGRSAVRLRVLGGPAAGPVILVLRPQRTVTRSAHRAAEQAVKLYFGVARLDAAAGILRLRSPSSVTWTGARQPRH